MKLLVATQNKGKLVEFRELLADLGYEVLSPIDFLEAIDLDVSETGLTFAENAMLKSKAFGEKTQTLSLADDSGL